MLHRQDVVPRWGDGHFHPRSAGQQERGPDPGGSTPLLVFGQLHRVRYQDVVRHRQKGEHGQLRWK